MVYFDSAYIAKFYLEEPDSAAVATLAVASRKVPSSVLGKLEVNSVFHRKLREAAIGASAHGFREIYSNDRHVLAAAPLFGLRGATAA